MFGDRLNLANLFLSHRPEFIPPKSAPKTLTQAAHTHWHTLARAKPSKASIGTRKTLDASPRVEPVANTGGGNTHKPTQATSHTSTNANTKKARGKSSWDF